MMTMITLGGDDDARRKLEQLGRELAARTLAGAAVAVEDHVEAAAGAHNRIGDLVRSIYRRADGEAWEIGHDLRVAPHALFVHWGTRPHVIRPKGASLDTQRELFGRDGTQRTLNEKGKLRAMPGRRKLVLRWPAGGKFVFAQFVNHPGYKGDAWMVRAADEAPRAFARLLDRAVARMNEAP